MIYRTGYEIVFGIAQMLSRVEVLMHLKVVMDPTMDTITDSRAARMSPFRDLNIDRDRLEYNHNSPALRQLQNSLVQPLQRILDGPVKIAASRTLPAESQSWSNQSTTKGSSTQIELLTAGSSSAKVFEGYQPTVMSVDDAFASEIAAQRKILADRQKMVEAERLKRHWEKRVAEEALAVQKAERVKRVAEQEAERTNQTAEREVKMEMSRLAEEKAKLQRQLLAELGPEKSEQHHRKLHNLGEQRVKMHLQCEAERHHNMRAQEKLLEQVYNEHNIDVVKVGTPSGGAMYAPWDSIVGDILEEQKREELHQKGIYFWLEAGIAVSVLQNHETLETLEDVTVSG